MLVVSHIVYFSVMRPKCAITEPSKRNFIGANEYKQGWERMKHTELEQRRIKASITVLWLHYSRSFDPIASENALPPPGVHITSSKKTYSPCLVC